MKAVLLFAVFGVELMSTAFSQRILCGEITYQHLSNTTYSFTINTISFTTPANFIEVQFGDGTSSFITTNNESIGNNYFLNTYILNHTFSGPGIFAVEVNCGYQMPGVVNSLLSLNDPFKLYCRLNILDPITLGYNNSPVFLSGLNDVTDINDVYSFSLIPYDPDGDELKFELSTFGTYDGYDNFCTIPDASNYIGIDSITGDFIWDKPLAYGRYFFAVKIYEYRGDVLLGWTLRTYMIDHYDPDASEEISIYPDPATDEITIQFSQNYFDRFGVHIYAINGQKIRSQDFDRPNNTTETIDISNLPAGVYLLTLMIAPQPVSRIFIKASNKL